MKVKGELGYPEGSAARTPYGKVLAFLIQIGGAST